MQTQQKMRQRHLALVLSAAATHLAAPATAQLTTSLLKPAPPAPQHTAIYTTTARAQHDPKSPQDAVITNVIVTILMPRDAPYFPSNGAPITGTAISHFSAAQPNGGSGGGTGISTWSSTAELFWTLSGNVPFGIASTNPPLPGWQDAKTTLTSVYTKTDFFSTDIYGFWVTHAHYDFYSTSRVTFVEAVGTGYPATIVRTGYTTLVATAIGGPVGGTETLTDAGTRSWLLTTTMVQVGARPTPWG